MRKLLLVLAGLGQAPQWGEAQSRPPGYTASAAAAQLAFEQGLQSSIDSARLRRHVEFFTARVRVAGSQAQVESADYVLKQLASYGFDTTRVEYRVYLPYHDSTYVDRVRPQFVKLPLRLLLNEIPIPGDSVSESSLWPAMAAYSGRGDVTGPLVFAHLGRPQDYSLLDSLGIDVAGKVALLRLGSESPTAQVREAEMRGARAVVLYSDPADDGYFRGDTYPIGSMRPPDGVERVSLHLREGDAATPGWAAAAEARRLPRDSMALPRIPVVPISYRNAMHLLPALGGPSVPQAWQGALPLRYHIGGDTSAVVRVAVWPQSGPNASKTIINTIATLPGGGQPDQIVFAGAKRDAWGRGAADNASGLATLLEAARAIGEAARRGGRPGRTITLATWDAGEWGNVGSTEYVEQNARRLQEQVVVYLNHDVTVSGQTFSGSADPSLAGLMAEAGGGLVPAADIAESPYCGDCLPFAREAGAPALEFGFRDPSGLLRSGYDGPAFLARVDPTLSAQVAAARLSAVLLSRFANAPVIAFDYARLGRGWSNRISRMDGGTNGGARATEQLARAVAGFVAESEEWGKARDRALASGQSTDDASSAAAVRSARRALQSLRDAAAAAEATRQVERATRALTQARKALQ